MRSPIIRLATLAEHRELERLQFRASLSNAGDRDSILAHPDAIAVPTKQIVESRVFVAELQGAIVGFAAIEQRPDGDYDLDALFVEPAMHRHGIGRALIRYCVEIAQKRKCIALHVIGNPHAKNFYHACGFELVGTTATRFGPALLMRKTL